MLTRPIPSTNEQIPVLGLGTWQTFDTAPSSYPVLEKVLSTLYSAGGRLIDSSPMYGRSENVIGEITSRMQNSNGFFYATKVWTTGLQEGILQMESSMKKMQRETMDLIQVHNLVDLNTHLSTLRKWKDDGRVRYTGITHYTDASHEELEKIIAKEKIDFVQFNYSIMARHAENRLLDAAAANGVATLINRPFGEGKIFAHVKNRTLPAWASEAGIDSWSTFFLKYIISHPAVTCVIPATGDPVHAADNVKAGEGFLPDNAMRKKMVEYITAL